MLAGSWGPILIDWASSQQPSPLCLTRSGWGGFAYSLDETSMKMKGRPPLIQAWHWLPGQQAFCAALQNGCICYEASDKAWTVLLPKIIEACHWTLSYGKADCCISVLLDWHTLHWCLRILLCFPRGLICLKCSVLRTLYTCSFIQISFKKIGSCLLLTCFKMA